MAEHNFPFRDKSAAPAPAKGLLDRANDLFHFEDAFKGGNLPPLDIPAELIPPEPDAPVATPEEMAGAGPSRAAQAVFPEQTDAPAAAPLFRARDWSGAVQTLDRRKMADAGYLVPDTLTTRTAEEFRIIRWELLTRMRGSRKQEAVPNSNVILIASAHSGDGKTYCAINLAISLAAETGVEVLLIDGDFAKPGIADALGLEPDRGLMDALADPAIAVEDLVIKTDVPSLYVLQAGNGGDEGTELLASPQMEKLIGALVSNRPERILIFDSPPLLAASSAAVLAGHVGQTVLVVRADRTSESALRDAAGLLKECSHVELLLNGVKFSSSGRRFGSYYGRDAK